MNTHNKHFHDKIGENSKISLKNRFVELSDEFPRSQKRVRISHRCSSQLCFSI